MRSFFLLTLTFFALQAATCFADSSDKPQLLFWTRGDFPHLNRTALKIYENLDYAAHYGSNGIGFYSLDAYNTREFLKMLADVDQQREAACQERVYTNDRKKILADFKMMLKKDKPFDVTHVPKATRKKHIAWVEKLIKSKNVAHVLYNGFKYEGAKVRKDKDTCDYFEMYFFFKDLTVLRLEFNFTL